MVRAILLLGVFLGIGIGGFLAWGVCALVWDHGGAW
jgi:hypothetical protein